MKEFQLCGLGNAIVDIFVEVSDAEFAALGFERGTMRLVELAEQKALLERFHEHEPRWSAAARWPTRSSPSRSSAAQAAFIGCVGDDRYGLFYAAEFEELGIDIGNPVIVGETTGTCVVPHHARRRAHHAHLPGGVQPPGGPARRRGAHQELGMAVHRGLRLRQSRHRPERHPRGHRSRQAARHQDRPHLLRGVHRQRLRRRRSTRRLQQADLLFCNETEACAVAKATTRRGSVRAS